MSEFRVSEQREMVSEDRAKELVEGLTTAVEKLSLSGKSYGLDASSFLKGFFTDGGIHEPLKHLDLSDVIAGRPEEEALMSLTALCEAFAASHKLESIDLSDNAMGTKGVKAVQVLVQDKDQLQHLYFRNNGLNADSVKLITELVLGGKESVPLKTLHLSKNLLESAGAIEAAELVSKSPSLEEFVMTSTRVGREGSVAITEALLQSRNLRHLDLSDNTLGEEGASALAEVVRTAKDLRVAVFRDISVEDDGMIKILEALVDNAQSLEVLDISTNELTAASANAIVTLLKLAPKLSKLIVEENELEDEGVSAVIAALDGEVHTALEEIHLSENGIAGKGALKVAEKAKSLPSLKRLELNGNTIPEDVVAELTAALGGVLGSLEDNIPDDDDDDDDGDDDDGED